MAPAHALIGEVCNDPFGAAVKLRRHTLGERSHLRNPHGLGASLPLARAQPYAIATPLRSTSEFKAPGARIHPPKSAWIAALLFSYRHLRHLLAGFGGIDDEFERIGVLVLLHELQVHEPFRLGHGLALCETAVDLV